MNTIDLCQVNCYNACMPGRSKASTTKASPRAIKRDAIRATILAHALALAEEGGLDAVGINSVARSVGYTPGALYSYFDSRDALLVSLQAEIFRSWAAQFASWHSLSHASAAYKRLEPVEAACSDLIVFVAGYAAISHLRPGQFRFISQMAGDTVPLVNDKHVQIALEAIQPILASFGETMMRLQSEGALEMELMLSRAGILFASMQGMLQGRKLMRLAPAPVEFGNLLSVMLRDQLTAWGLPPATIRKACQHVYKHVPEIKP